MLGRLKQWYRTRQQAAPQAAAAEPVKPLGGIFIMEMARREDGTKVISTVNEPKGFIDAYTSGETYRSRTGKTINSSPTHKYVSCRTNHSAHHLLIPEKERTHEKKGDATSLAEEHEIYTRLMQRGLPVPEVVSFDGTAFVTKHKGENLYEHTQGFWRKTGTHEEIIALDGEIRQLMHDAVGLNMRINEGLDAILTAERKHELQEQQYLDVARKAGVTADEVRKHHHAYRIASALGVDDSAFIESCAPLERIMENAERKYAGQYWDGNPSNIIVDKEGKLWGVDYNNMCPKSLQEAISGVIDEYYTFTDFPWMPRSKEKVATQGCNRGLTTLGRRAALDWVRAERNVPAEDFNEFMTAYVAARIVTSVRNFGYAARAAKEHSEFLESKLKGSIRETMHANDPYEMQARFIAFSDATQRMMHFKQIIHESTYTLAKKGVTDEERPAVERWGEELFNHVQQHCSAIPQPVVDMYQNWVRYAD